MLGMVQNIHFLHLLLNVIHVQQGDGGDGVLGCLVPEAHPGQAPQKRTCLLMWTHRLQGEPSWTWATFAGFLLLA